MRYLILFVAVATVVLALGTLPSIVAGLDEHNSYQAQLHQLDLSARLSAQQEAERGQRQRDPAAQRQRRRSHAASTNR